MDYPAEVFDQIQLLYDTNGFNDHELHCVLKFEHEPDAEILRKSVVASIEAISILGTRYVAGAKPHWTSLDPADFGRAVVIARTEIEFQAFTVSRVDESVGPQIRVCLLDSGPFAVALKLNHMVCDAAGFKSYLYFLSKIYSEMRNDPSHRPTAIVGDRSMRAVLKHFTPEVKFKSLFLQRRDNNRSGDHRFPMSEGGEAQPFILTRKLGPERVAALKYYCRDKGATLNDAVLTAFYRGLFHTLELRPRDELQIPLMVDMRRYLGETGEPRPLTNLSSMVMTQLDYRPEEPFECALGRVKAVMDAKKGADIGLNAFIKLDLLYRILGDRTANRLLRSQLKQPLICMTNVGVLDSARISFGDLRPYDAFMCGSIKYKPYFQLAISSYADELTLSVNLSGDPSDRDRILSFFDTVEAELPN
jgi:NRPS condensation-like uncharacterized protein